MGHHLKERRTTYLTFNTLLSKRTIISAISDRKSLMFYFTSNKHNYFGNKLRAFTGDQAKISVRSIRGRDWGRKGGNGG